MSLIVSACIPTRGRVLRLIKTLGSLRQSCDDPDTLEILLRVDDDDKATIAALPEIVNEFGVRFHIGPRNLGYDSMGEFVTELSDLALAPWIFIIDDDAVVVGKGMDTKLKAVSLTDRHVAVCEYYKLNQSVYRAALPVGMFVPNKCWNQYGRNRLESPVDEFLRSLLISDHGWKLSLLPGMTYFHEWDDETMNRRAKNQNNP